MTTLFEFAPTGAKTNGAAVPADPAVYDTVDAGVVWDTAVKLADLTASAKADNAAGTTVRTLDQLLPAAVTTRRLVRVMQVAAFTAGTFVTLTRWRTPANASVGEVRVNSQGKLILRDDTNGTVLATTTPSITFGQPFRYEVDIVEQPGATPDQATLRLYLDPLGATPDATLGPFAHGGGSFDRIVDGVGTAAAGTVVRVLYAADGDTENPSITRFAPDTAPPGGGEGVRTYLVTSGGEVLLTSTDLV